MHIPLLVLNPFPIQSSLSSTMSQTVEPPPPESPPSESPKVELYKKPDLGSDLLLWRRKQLNVVILFAATATWMVMEVYKYSFITVLSWVAMALVACLFFWGNINRLLKKEAPDLSELEISEETAMEHAKLFRQRGQDGLRLMLHVSCEREWSVFVGVVTSLFLLALVAAHLDFLTICYIGIVVGMTMPVTYVKNEHKIREFAEKWRMKSQRLYSVIEEKLQKMKSKIGGRQKEKKQE